MGIRVGRTRGRLARVRRTRDVMARPMMSSIPTRLEIRSSNGPHGPVAKAEPVQLGSILGGKYRVEEILGRGGMGVVVSARHLGLDELVAIKVMLPDMLEVSGTVERFLREARAVAKLKSDHVVRVHDVDTLPSGVPYIVMELLVGADLASVCRQESPLDVQDAVGYVIEACDAIAEAHALGIIHRDLKPGNLFLARRRDGETVVKVLDFGVSIILHAGAEQVRITDAGQTLGSPSYMSPEQMLSSHGVDPRTDIWALGALLYRLLTGVTPFQGDNVDRIRSLVLNRDPTPPIALRHDVPRGLSAIILRCLEKDRSRRFPTASVLADALLPFARADLPAGNRVTPSFREAPMGSALMLSDGPPVLSRHDSISGTTKPVWDGRRGPFHAASILLVTGLVLCVVMAVVALPFRADTRAARSVAVPPLTSVPFIELEALPTTPSASSSESAPPASASAAHPRALHAPPRLKGTRPLF